jgi:tetratricopeptide (TPR) repeat protein
MVEAQISAKQLRAMLRAHDYEQALPVLDALIRKNPDDAPARWHRASCLEAFDRLEEALAEIKQVLRIKPGYAPAWIKQAELAITLDEGYPDFEADLRQAVAVAPNSAASLRALASFLHGEARTQEAHPLLAKAMALEPDNPENFTLRALWLTGEAYTLGPGEQGIKQFTGAELSRPKLESALADMNQALRLQPNQPHFLVQRAAILHQLQRFDAAVADYDTILSLIPTDSPKRAAYLEMRKRSENQGAGEREQATQFLDQALATLDAKERSSMAGDMAVSALRSSEIAIGQGKNLDQALAQFVSDDPMDMLATNAAYQIYQVGNEAQPDYAESRSEDYPRFQRAFAQQALQVMSKAGFEHVGDYEPLHLREMLGKPTLVRVYSGDQGAIFAASYRIAPKWPGWLGFLLAFFTGQWKKPALIELITAVSDGQFLITNNSGGVDPFAYGGVIATEQMPLGAKIPEVIKRHRARLAEYLGIHHKEQAQRATTMEEMLPFLSKLAAAKNQYRKSIGYISDAELHRLLGKHYDLLAERVRARLSALAK